MQDKSGISREEWEEKHQKLEEEVKNNREERQKMRD